jgi:hypothetical protein
MAVAPEWSILAQLSRAHPPPGAQSGLLPLNSSSTSLLGSSEEREDLVRGLTTAATIWLTAAIGMACGAGLPILAIAVTAGHFIVVGVFPAVERRLPKSRWAPSQLHISYRGGQGVLREVLAICTQHDFAVSRVQVEGDQKRPRKQSGFQAAKGHDKGSDDEGPASEEDSVEADSKGVVTLLIEVRGIKSIPKLAARRRNPRRRVCTGRRCQLYIGVMRAGLTLLGPLIPFIAMFVIGAAILIYLFWRGK